MTELRGNQQFGRYESNARADPARFLKTPNIRIASVPTNDTVLQYMDRGGFDEALESLNSLIADYAELGQAYESHHPGDSHAVLAF